LPLGARKRPFRMRAAGIDWPCAGRSMKPGVTTSPVASITPRRRPALSQRRRSSLQDRHVARGVHPAGRVHHQAPADYHATQSRHPLVLKPGLPEAASSAGAMFDRPLTLYGPTDPIEADLPRPATSRTRPDALLPLLPHSCSSSRGLRHADVSKRPGNAVSRPSREPVAGYLKQIASNDSAHTTPRCPRWICPGRRWSTQQGFAEVSVVASQFRPDRAPGLEAVTRHTVWCSPCARLA
jgi:hypothetical protein